MPTFRLIPVDVEAIQWTGDNLDQIFTLTGRIKQDLPAGMIGIYSPGESGYRDCLKGDWVVKHPDGSVKPMMNITFLDTYAPVAE